MSNSINNKCSLCGSENSFVKYTIENSEIRRCPDCTLMWLDPMPTDEELEKVYSKNYYENKELASDDAQKTYGYSDYLSEKLYKQIGFQKIVNQIKSLLHANNKKISLLELGCGLGFFLDVAQDAGFTVEGTEFNKYAIKWIADKYRFPVSSKKLNDFEDNSYDVICMMDVIEHLRDPFDVINESHRVLKNGGILTFTTMECDSFISRLLGDRLEDIRKIHEHLFFFTKKSIKKSLKKSGFAVEKINYTGHTFSCGDLVERIAAMVPFIGKPCLHLVNFLHLRNLKIYVNPRTKVTVYARKI